MNPLFLSRKEVKSVLSQAKDRWTHTRSIEKREYIVNQHSRQGMVSDVHSIRSIGRTGKSSNRVRTGIKDFSCLQQLVNLCCQLLDVVEGFLELGAFGLVQVELDDPFNTVGTEDGRDPDEIPACAVLPVTISAA